MAYQKISELKDKLAQEKFYLEEEFRNQMGFEQIIGLKATMPRFDYIGFGLLAVGVGALQVALDNGQEDDWFGSHFITTVIVIAAVGLIFLVICESRHKEPIVDVRLFKMFNFAAT